MRRTAHVIVYAGLIGYWTYLLLKPHPIPEELLAGLPWFDEWWRFLVAKLLHLGSYAAMAVLGGPLVRDGRPRAVLFCLLGLHGALTELGQYLGNEWYQTHRTGCVRDVLIDAAGVCLGALALRVVRIRPTGGPP